MTDVQNGGVVERESGKEAVQPVENLTPYQMEKFQAIFNKFRRLADQMEAAFLTLQKADEEGIRISLPKELNFDFAGFYNASMKEADDIGNKPFSFGDLAKEMAAYNPYVQNKLQEARNTRNQQKIGELHDQL